ncbi:hypothetical protein [Caldimonas brevitalea]|uniref:Uncharacterized protein n=1 Tax=Caldimonas brevitalea TaxID=413882 RepID=A0A0G3BKR2_9BURK|nr:hypothetical protein [Caldimonas brevitalea]AKJ28578.1 hypothetical protein AAW51_1887 [Caldimonas brevitalea]
MATYDGQSSRPGYYRFTTSHGEELRVPREMVLGYRPRVAHMHPPGEIRPPEENLADRSHVNLSDGNLSYSLAQIRHDRSQADRIAATTYGPHSQHQDYQDNAHQLNMLGVPIVPNVDMAAPSTAGRLGHLPPDAHMHFQMPRVPQGTSGYSTQRLVHDTLGMPHQMGAPGMTVSITAPDPSQYNRPGTHNRIYGLENGSAAQGTYMHQTSAVSGADQHLEQYGYEHSQTTTNQSTSAADYRRTYGYEYRR